MYAWRFVADPQTREHRAAICFEVCCTRHVRVQESIKASSQWFMACTLHAHGMAQMMLQRVHHLAAFQAQLHVVYLLNDILFTGCAPPGACILHCGVFAGPGLQLHPCRLHGLQRLERKQLSGDCSSSRRSVL